MKNQKTDSGEPDRTPAGPEAASEKNSPASLFKGAQGAKIVEQNAGILGSGSTDLSEAVSGKLVETKKLFGQNLARIRQSAGYSQLALSVEVDLSSNFINELEQGAKGASFETLTRLSLVLRAPVHQFFEPVKKAPPHDDFQYPDPIDKLIASLHEALEVWNDQRVQ
jgi:transcriptional regulator with XRE-family HTH domain